MSTADLLNFFNAFFWMGLLSRVLLIVSTRWRDRWTRLAIVHLATIASYAMVMRLLFSDLFITAVSLFQPGWIEAALLWIAVDVFLMLRTQRLSQR